MRPKNARSSRPAPPPPAGTARAGRSSRPAPPLPAGTVRARRSSRPAPPPPAGTARAGRILLIDDEPLVIKAVTRMLPRKHAIEPHTSAPEAFARLKRGERYDVILCDLMMPEMSGMEFYERVASVSQEQAARIVFITGGSFIAEAREFLAQLPNGRLHKPFAKEALLSALSRFFTDPPGG